MKIAVIGTGYVGLVAGVCLADSGQDVTCVDIDADKVEKLSKGELTIYEPGLGDLLHRNLHENRISFTTDMRPAVADADVVFIAVGTPPGDNGKADLQYVHQAAEDIGKAMKGYTIVVLKSTVPVGTAFTVRDIIARQTAEEFDVVNNPEFMKEGDAVKDFVKPDRVIIGADSERAARIMGDIYAPFLRTEKPFLVMDNLSAEMTKYAANAMLATKISFINEIACLCNKVGADIDQVRKGIGFDSRIGFQFLFPGLGYGGSCFPKDVQAAIYLGQEQGWDMHLLSAVERVNQRQKTLLLDLVHDHFGRDIAGKQFAMWGLAFKPQTDDVREAPALAVARALVEAGARVRAYDPEAIDTARAELGDIIEYADGPYEALVDAEALLITTEWNEFRRPNFMKMRTHLKQPLIFDGRNIYQPTMLRQYGFTYYSIGRPGGGPLSEG